MAEIEFTSKGGRKRKYVLDILTIMFLSSTTKAGDIARIYDVPVGIITKISDGRYVLEGDELDPERIKTLGLKVCECCGKRIVPLVSIKTNKHYVQLHKLCSFCYRYADAGALQDHKFNVSNNNMPN